VEMPKRLGCWNATCECPEEDVEDEGRLFASVSWCVS